MTIFTRCSSTWLHDWFGGIVDREDLVQLEYWLELQLNSKSSLSPSSLSLSRSTEALFDDKIEEWTDVRTGGRLADRETQTANNGSSDW